jgi:hypothetical protein
MSSVLDSCMQYYKLCNESMSGYPDDVKDCVSKTKKIKRKFETAMIQFMQFAVVWPASETPLPLRAMARRMCENNYLLNAYLPATYDVNDVEVQFGLKNLKL